MCSGLHNFVFSDEMQKNLGKILRMEEAEASWNFVCAGHGYPQHDMAA